MLEYSYQGYAKQYKTIKVEKIADVTFDATLAALKPLTIARDGSATDDERKIKISGVRRLGDGSSARVFNPVTETDKFPGAFNDVLGNSLISGVFVAFDLKDDSNQPIKDLPAGENATIKMKIPRDTWSSINDVTPGNGQIDVPMYYFDETNGQWVASGDTGILETGLGEVINPSDLPSIQNKSFVGDIMAVAEVGHFSYWNVDWPIDTRGAVKGRVLDSNQNPVGGANVMLKGVTFTGTSGPTITSADGTFCFETLRSEATGEDIDNNGITGEEQRVVLTAEINGSFYKSEEVILLTTQKTCPNGQPYDFNLVDTNKITPVLCTIDGTVMVNGTPFDGFPVWGIDNGLDPDTYISLCAPQPGGYCASFSSSGTSGHFSLKVPMSTSVDIAGFVAVEDDPVASFLYGVQTTLTSCPTSPITLNAEMQLCTLTDYLTATVSGNDISWNPPTVKVGFIIVSSANGDYKWALTSETGGITSPITYGTVPTGSVQTTPPKGALASGDLISIIIVSEAIPYNGYACYQPPMIDITVP